MPILQKDNVYILCTKNCSYALRVNRNGTIQHLHWGAPVANPADFNEPLPPDRSGFHDTADMLLEEISSFGTLRYKQPSVKLRYADGVRDFRFKATAVSVQQDSLYITLLDAHYPFQIDMHYKLFYEEDCIARWQVAYNHGTEPIVLESFASAQLGLHGAGWQALNFDGQWAAEFQTRVQTLHVGKTMFEGLRGITGHTANPATALYQQAGEAYGEVFGAVLEYGGNFKITAEVTPYRQVNLVLGASDTDFAWQLEPGASFAAPTAYLCYAPNGLTGMSQRFHALAHNHIMPAATRGKALPVLYNSWEATLFDVSAKSQMELADKAKELGVELFVMDDGWFGERHNDLAGLGDWDVNVQKFPKGLDELIHHVNKLGMQFGIWVEPEMVNPDSRLYRRHPEWVYQYQNRPVLQGRNQYQLDMTRQDVREYLLDCLDKLLSRHNIDYVKWDYNRSLAETSPDPGKTPAQQKEVWVRHTEGFEWLINTLREKHPAVEFEACASGGGRVNFAAMRSFDEYWPSDNTDALDRLGIQHGYSMFYPARYMRTWVTDCHGDAYKRQIPLSFRIHAAMCGAMGIGCNLNSLPPQDVQQIADAVTTYKSIRNVVQLGTLYRLNTLERDGLQAVQYNKEGKAVIFTFVHTRPMGYVEYRVKPRGLVPDAVYSFTIDGKPQQKTGAWCMHTGIPLPLRGDYDSHMLVLEKLG